MNTRNMQKLLLTIIPLLFTGSLYSQSIKGKITTESGNPIPYATVYIKELRQGTTAGTKGEYEIRIPEGRYLVTYQSLGYAPVIQEVSVSRQGSVKDVILPLQYYQIPEVRIMASGEDPAYRVMRKAVGMAPYYLNNIKHYKAEVYLKGNLAINRIPKIMQKAINVEARREEGGSISSNTIKEGDVYLMESFNEIEFTAPDKYVQKVISVNSTFPDEGDNVSPMDLIQASFYEPVIADMAISPLSPQAFQYYNFRYQGATLQGDYTVNKIAVIPKRKSQQLFEGTIYIIEDLWCIHSIDLTNDNLAGKISVEQLYIPVENEIWMPVSHNFSIQVSVLGFKADAGYGGSVKYTEVLPDEKLRKPEGIETLNVNRPLPSQQTAEAKPGKNQQKIEEILQKDEISNREMIKLARLMENEAKEARPDSVNKSLEIVNNTTTTVEKDAGKRDSAFWAAIRPVPLSIPEQESIRKRDSIRSEISGRRSTDTLTTGSPKKKNMFFRTLSDISLGHTWSDTSGLSFHFAGLVNMTNLTFNSVDGFVYGTDFRLSQRKENRNVYSLSPEFKWAFGREKLLWRVNGSYTFDRANERTISFRTGVTSGDFGSGGTINPFLNSVTSLFFKNNYLRLYESSFAAAGFRTRIANGLYAGITGEFEKRRLLDNSTNFSFSGVERDYYPNLPENEYLNPPLLTTDNELRNQDHYEIVTNVTFTPRQRYYINKGIRIPAGSDWPVFGFTWEHGINETAVSSPGYRNYDRLKLQISRSTEPGAFSEFRWLVRAGTLINKEYVSFYDFNHFNSQPLYVLLDDYQDAFRLRRYYSLSTPGSFAEVHLKYTTPYLLVKYLPGISNTLMRENISVSWLGTGSNGSYTELGYSISEIWLLGELGIYAGFDNLRFRSFGARLVLKIG